MKFALVTAAAVALATGPASAAMMSCSGENMTKTSNAMTTMQDGPNKTAMGKEMGMANTGNEQRQHEGRVCALHEGTEDGRDEKRYVTFPRPAGFARRVSARCERTLCAGICYRLKHSPASVAGIAGRRGRAGRFGGDPI